MIYSKSDDKILSVRERIVNLEPQQYVYRLARDVFIKRVRWSIYLARSDDIYLGGDYAKYIRRAGLHETLITAETYVNPFPETHVDVSDPLPSLHCFAGATFFHLQSPSFPPASPSSFPVVRIRRFSSPAARHRHRVYGTYGGRYVLWLIVLLSLTYFQFTAAARHFASWLSIVRDERRFICHPGYSGLRPARVLSARHSSCRIRDKRYFHGTKKISGISLTLWKFD